LAAFAKFSFGHGPNVRVSIRHTAPCKNAQALAKPINLALCFATAILRLLDAKALLSFREITLATHEPTNYYVVVRGLQLAGRISSNSPPWATFSNCLMSERNM
jgi:hypothetical protein